MFPSVLDSCARRSLIGFLAVVAHCQCERRTRSEDMIHVGVETEKKKLLAAKMSLAAMQLRADIAHMCACLSDSSLWCAATNSPVASPRQLSPRRAQKKKNHTQQKRTFIYLFFVFVFFFQVSPRVAEEPDYDVPTAATPAVPANAASTGAHNSRKSFFSFCQSI